MKEVYEVKGPDGQIYEVKADSAEQAAQAFAPKESGGFGLLDVLMSAATPITTAMRLTRGPAEAGLSMLDSAATEIPAGLAGLGTLVANIGDPNAGVKAGQTVQDVRNTAYRPQSEAGKQYLQGVGTVMAPVGRAIDASSRYLGDKGVQLGQMMGFSDQGTAALGAAAYTIPTAALTLAGPRITGETNTPGFLYDASGLPKPVPRARVEPSLQPTPAGPTVPPVANGRQPASSDYGQIIQSIDKQRARVVAEDVKPNPEVMAAADRQGITLNPSHYSQNPTYIELEQALKSRPGSKLAEGEINAIRQIGERADALVAEIGGNVDRSVFDLKLRSSIDGTINELTRRADSLYEKTRAAIPPRTVVDAPNARAYIESTLGDLGGNKARLSAPERDLLTLLDEKQTLTYAALDRLRKDIGQGFDRLGPYGDTNSAILKQVYKALSDDQLSIADGFGVGGALRAGNALTQSKAALQESAQSLFGKTLEKSVLPRVRSVANDLAKGNTASFTSLLNTVPKGLRRDTATAVLNEIFSAGSRNGASVGQGFANAFRGLSKNKGALAALLKELPEEAAQRFTDLGKIADSLFRAKAVENTSKTARDLIAAMDQPRTFERIYKGIGEVSLVEGITSSVGLPGVGTVGSIAHIVLKGRTPSTIAADQFIGSPALRRAIELVAKGDVQAADRAVTSSAQFKNWISTLPQSESAQIAKLGFIGWLTSNEQQ